MYANPHPGHMDLCDGCGGHGYTQPNGSTHCGADEHCLDIVPGTADNKCQKCSGNGTASGRLKYLVVDASGPCSSCNGGHLVHDPDFPGTTKLLNAHHLGAVLGEHNGCADCNGTGRASGQPFHVWFEMTQEEHDYTMAEKQQAVAEQQASEAERQKLADRDEADRLLVQDPKADMHEKIMALARLNRHI